MCPDIFCFAFKNFRLQAHITVKISVQHKNITYIFCRQNIHDNTGFEDFFKSQKHIHLKSFNNFSILVIFNSKTTS